MTDNIIALTLGFFTLAIINLAVQIHFSLSISAHLQNGYNLSKIIEIRRLANRGLLSGLVAFLIWGIIAWGIFSSPHLSLDTKILFAIGIFALLGMNLLIPLHYEERLTPSC